MIMPVRARLERLHAARHRAQRRRGARRAAADALGEREAREQVDEVVLAEVHERETRA